MLSRKASAKRKEYCHKAIAALIDEGYIKKTPTYVDAMAGGYYRVKLKPWLRSYTKDDLAAEEKKVQEIFKKHKISDDAKTNIGIGISIAGANPHFSLKVPFTADWHLEEEYVDVGASKNFTYEVLHTAKRFNVDCHIGGRNSKKKFYKIIAYPPVNSNKNPAELIRVVLSYYKGFKNVVVVETPDSNQAIVYVPYSKDQAIEWRKQIN